MKYKLINKQTNEEHICDRVTADGYDYYVSDYERLISYSNFIPRSNIIATNIPNIDVPKVVNEVEKMANIHAVQSGCEYREDLVRISKGYLAGYNKSQETHPFSEVDMIEFLRFVENNYYFNSGCWVNCDTDEVVHRKELLQLWKDQQLKIVYYQ